VVLLSDICPMPKGRKLKTTDQLLGLLLSGSLSNHVVKNEKENTLTCRPCNWTRPIDGVFTQRAGVHFKSTCHLNKSKWCFKEDINGQLTVRHAAKNRSLMDFFGSQANVPDRTVDLPDVATIVGGSNVVTDYAPASAVSSDEVTDPDSTVVVQMV